MGWFLGIVAFILAIITGNQAGAAIGSGLVGFVLGVVSFGVYRGIGAVIHALFSVGNDVLDDRRHYRSTHGKIKSY